MMKIVCRQLSAAALILFVLSIGSGIFATNTEFQTTALSEEEKSLIVMDLNVTPMEQAPAKASKSIQCFDVNENHMIAIGQNEENNQKRVCVYSSDWVFQYGFTFCTYGTFAVEWAEEYIYLFLARGGILVTLDPLGNVLDVTEVTETAENRKHENDLLYTTKRIVDDTEYIIRNDMGILNVFASSYAQLLMISKDGEQTILYDANDSQLAKTLLLVGAIVVFWLIATIIIARVIYKVIKKQKKDC